MSRTPSLALATVALVTGGIAIGTSEFVVMGLLPELAHGIGVDIPTAGQAISAYAIGVVVGAPLLSAVAAGRPRRGVLIALMAAFLVGNIGTALAPNLGLVLVARFLAGLPHGAYFGLAAIVAVSLARAGRGPQAVSRVMLGIPVANLAGVPLATALGQAFGWRAAFWMVAAIAALTLVMLRAMVPYSGPTDQSIRSELGALMRPQLWLAMAIGAIGFGGQFSMFSYIKPLLLHVTGASMQHVPLVLLVFGFGGLVGTWLGGLVAGRSVWGAMFGGLGAMVTFFSLLALNAAGPLPLVTFLVGMGAASAAMLVIGLQMHLMNVAGSAQNLGASLNHAALNFANALGAAAGGLVLSWGWGWVAPTWTSVALSLAGIVIAIVALLVARAKDEPGVRA
ncbi:MFS transporter [Propioniferax innocua]|uniref:DHA1 family inner membrane transport protein n=1 Tax=Propioniferax innocua TaxID=1753 RepID=A0A542ZRL5_9ACTN|nr:MFS transporter [Propioniferax innocua]TQL62889.1 DHA1 family inner membrane transport protein [Propioniferax innocua]